MNRTVKTILIVFGVLTTAAVFVLAGFFIGQRLNWWNNYRYDNFNNASPFQAGGMMGRSYNNRLPQNYGMGMGRGTMGGGYYSNRYDSNVVLSVDEARGAVENYLASLGYDDLEIEEVMIFDQNAYAVVVEEISGIGAMELLVDHDTQSVYPEYGPNRMWNTKYGMMGGGGCGSSDTVNCGWGLNDSAGSVTGDMTISLDEATEIANEYLAENIPGAETAEEGYTFYGYYTFDYMENDQMAGMLSVHGSTGQVWLHTWHGQFIEEWELEGHD